MHATYSHTRYDKDPLTLAIAPPDNESPQAKEARLSLELEAKRRSDAIDEEIDRQRAAEKKGNSPVKVLLLGEHHCVAVEPFRLIALIDRTERIRYDDQNLSVRSSEVAEYIVRIGKSTTLKSKSLVAPGVMNLNIF